MSGRLVGEVAEWLRTPAAGGLTVAERMVLVTIAERANEKTRMMWRHRTDDVSPSERIREVVGVSRQNLTKVFNRLAERGLEVRAQVGTTDAGKPVFAHKGHATDFRLPDLPASVQLPQSDAQTRRIGPVDNPPREPPRAPSGPSQSDAHRRGFDAKGTPGGVAKGSKATPRGVPHPSKDSPSTTDPSSCGSSTYGVAVEDEPPADATPSGEPKIQMGWEPDYIEAREYLFTLANEGQEFMDAALLRLGERADIADRVICAAQLAKEAS